MQCAWEQKSQLCFFISIELSLELCFISRHLLFLVIHPMSFHHIKIYHSTWQSHFLRFTEVFVVAVRLTLANDLPVSFFLTPTKTLTTCRHVYFIRPLIRPNLLNRLCCRKHVHWYCKHALRSKDIPDDARLDYRHFPFVSYFFFGGLVFLIVATLFPLSTLAPNDSSRMSA